MYQASLPFTQNKSTKTKTIPVGLKMMNDIIWSLFWRINDKK